MRASVAVAVLLVLLGPPRASAAGPRIAYRFADQRAARTAIIEVVEFPGSWKLELSPPGARIPYAPPCTGYDPDLSGLTETGASVGIAVVKGFHYNPVRLAATVFDTERDARRAFGALSGAEFRRCLARGATNATTRVLARGARGAAVAAVRVAAGGGSGRQPVLDYVTVRRGRVAWFLLFEGVGKTPPAGYERDLIDRIAARAELPLG